MTIEDAADNNGIVRSIIVAEHTTRMVRAPREYRPAEQTMKKAHIERVKDLVQVVVVAMRSKNALTATRPPDVFGLTRDRLGRDVATIAVGMIGRDRLFVEFCQQNMSDGMVNRIGCMLENVREAHMQPSVAQSNGCIERGKAAEADVNGWDRRTRAEIAILLLKD